MAYGIIKGYTTIKIVPCYILIMHRVAINQESLVNFFCYIID